MDLIVTYVEEGFFSRECLVKLIKKSTTPFQYTKDGYTTVTKGPGNTACTSVLSLSAMSSVLLDKRTLDELSWVEAKRRKLNAGKKQQTPNTTRSECGFSVIHKLNEFDSLKESEEKDIIKSDLEKM